MYCRSNQAQGIVCHFSAEFTCRGIQNAVAVLGAVGLGASYTLIHIYVTPLKRFLQAMFVLGALGGAYLMLTQVGLTMQTRNRT